MVGISGVAGSRPTANDVRVDIEVIGSGEITGLDADILIYATGYKPVDPLGFLGELSSLCKMDSQGRPLVDRDYRMVTAENVRCGLYLQGGTEHIHGLSSSFLSNLAVRAAEIVESLERTREADDGGR